MKRHLHRDEDAIRVISCLEGSLRYGMRVSPEERALKRLGRFLSMGMALPGEAVDG